MNHFRATFLGACGVLLFAFAPGTARSSGAQEYPGSPSISSARDLYERAHYDESRAMLEALITAGRVDAEILYYRGLLEPDMVVAADRYFGEITRRWPGTEWSDRALFRIAQYQYDTGSYLTARRNFGSVAWRQGDSSLGQEARYWRGMTWLHAIGKVETARDSIRIALRSITPVAREATDPDVKGQALISTAELHLALGQADSALAWAGQILGAPYLNDYHPRAMLIQARARDLGEENEQARSIFQAVTSRYPETLESREARRWLLDNRERLVQARLDTMTAAGEDTLEISSEESRWTIQVGAFTRLANASSLVATLTSRGYHAWHTSKRVGSTIYVVVNVGRFATRAEASAYRRELIASAALEEAGTPIVSPIPPE